MQNDGEKKEGGVRTFAEDVESKGGTIDDQGVVFETQKNTKDSATADIKQPEKTKRQDQPRPDSILTNKDDVFDVTGAFRGKNESGTIITDKRRKRKSLGSAFVDAITEWAGKAKEKTEHKKLSKSEPTNQKVAPARARKKTIEKASAGSVHAPTDDHKVVIEKMRTLDSDAKKITGKPYLIKKRNADAPKWTHTKGESKESEEKKEPTPADSPKATLAPGSEYRFVAPEVSQHSQLVHEKKRPKQPEKTEKEEEKQEQKEKPKEEHLVASDSARVTEPLPEYEPHPSQERRDKAKEQKKKDKKKFNWWFLFQGLDNIKKKFSKTPKTPDTNSVKEKESVPQPIPPKVATPVPQPEQSPKEDPVPQAEPVEDGPTISSRAPVTEKPSVFHDEPDSGETSPEIAKRIAALKKQSRETRSKKKGPRRSRLIVFASIVLIAVIGGIGASYFFLVVKKDAGVLELPNPIVSFLVVDKQVSVPLSDNRTTLLSTLSTAVNSAEGAVTQIYPVRRETNEQNEAREVPATTAEIMAVLEPRAPSPFLRSLEENMMLGSISTAEGNEPFVVMKSRVFDVAFAGMLDWESFMSADLAPLFGPPVARTFDEDARTIDGTTNAYFQDTVVANHGTRILHDEVNRERIAYSFVDRETIVITTNTNALETLFDALRIKG